MASPIALATAVPLAAIPPLVILATLVLLAVVIVLVSAPLRAAREAPDAASVRRAELDAAREAKYREIRDAELDYATGKLSPADYEAVDAALRGEAMAILRELEALDGDAGGAPADGGGVASGSG